VPKKKSPNYKYVETVRIQGERKKLGTTACNQCETVLNFSLSYHYLT
jgi:hypothetical protein